MPAWALGPERGWIVRSHISWGGEGNIFYMGVMRHFKNLEGNPERKAKRTIFISGKQRGQCLLAVGLDGFNKRPTDRFFDYHHLISLLEK